MNERGPCIWATLGFFEGSNMAAPEWAAWPSIPVSDWVDTRDTLHLYTQVVGKVRMVNEPMSNHWWNVPLYVTARGLTTSPIPHPTGPVFQIDFDFIDHRLDVETVTGQTRSVELVPRTVTRTPSRPAAPSSTTSPGSRTTRPTTATIGVPSRITA